ncbi:hypothetical protein [Paracidovorax sp. MALMAid1276]|uniref:hypothetical protein n=1 Tax=Paracidovorax sp. MALMAid1276 TaxID=3411631 RepID=UPI003B9D2355
MIALAAALGRYVLRHFLSFVLICAVLLLAQWGWAQWRAWQALQAEGAELQAAQATVSQHIATEAAASRQRTAQLAQAPLAVLTERLQALDTRLQTRQQERASLGGLASLGTLGQPGTPFVQAHLKGLRLDVDIALLQQERTYVQELRWRLQATQSAEHQRAELERLRQAHQRLYAQWQAVQAERQALLQAHPIQCRVPLDSPERRACEALRQQQAALLAANQRAAADHAAQQARLAATPPAPAPLGAFEPLIAPLHALAAPLLARQTQLLAERGQHWMNRMAAPVQQVLPVALWILLGIVLAPIGIKALLYFVVAPLAQRCAPVQLLPGSGGTVALAPGGSGVSCVVALQADQELLVHPEFLQSTAVQGDKDTCWLFSREYAFTSLAAGLVALTRVRTPATAQHVVSATQDPHSEVAVLDLPEGTALVMQPHNLVGVLQHRGAPVRITSHWRLASLHAWLTLQLRYLAFHGPAQLIVQGSRGVRVEQAQGGRSIQQAATIGFTPNLAYTTRRSDTFGAYLLGKQGLFNDHFAAGTDADGGALQGCYVYAEMPHTHLRGGRARRGLEGVLDSVLKVFGV